MDPAEHDSRKLQTPGLAKPSAGFQGEIYFVLFHRERSRHTLLLLVVVRVLSLPALLSLLDATACAGGEESVVSRTSIEVPEKGVSPRAGGVGQVVGRRACGTGSSEEWLGMGHRLWRNF